MEVQKPTGNFTTSFIRGMTNAYYVVNVVVRVVRYILGVLRVMTSAVGDRGRGVAGQCTAGLHINPSHPSH